MSTFAALEEVGSHLPAGPPLVQACRPPRARQGPQGATLGCPCSGFVTRGLESSVLGAEHASIPPRNVPDPQPFGVVGGELRRVPVEAVPAGWDPGSLSVRRGLCPCLL